MATGAVLNAVWDLWAKREQKPMWKHLVDLSPEQLVSTHRLLVHHATSSRRDEAVAMLRAAAAPALDAREAEMRARRAIPPTRPRPAGSAIPTTRCAASAARPSPQGWTAFKMKVGQNLEDNIRRAAIMREEIGPDRTLMMDANQCWDVDEAITPDEGAGAVRSLVDRGADQSRRRARARRASRGRSRRSRVATGEVCQNRVMFKQLLQADAIRYVQVDSCRMGGVNEALAVMLMAHKFGEAGVPARRRRRAVRVRAAPVDLRLHRGQRLAGGSRVRVRRPSARALRRSVHHQQRALRRTASPGLQHRHQAAVDRRLRVPGRTRLAHAEAMAMR